MTKLTEQEILEELETETDFCIICHKNTVTWPMVCDECAVLERQNDLFEHYVKLGLAGWEFDEQKNKEAKWCKMTCLYCGMIHDGGITCYYCGVLNPTDEIEDEADYFEDEEISERLYQIIDNGLYESEDD